MAGIEPRAVLRFLSLLIVCATVAFIAERTSSALRPPAHTWVAPDDRGEPQSRGMRALPPPPAVALPAGPLVFNAGPAEVTALPQTNDPTSVGQEDDGSDQARPAAAGRPDLAAAAIAAAAAARRTSNEAAASSKVATLSIHLFAFNRPDKFTKLWLSLGRAQAIALNCHVVVHIDYDASNSPEWRRQVADAKRLAGTTSRHGPVSVLFAARPKGLRVTMLEAWAPRPNEYAMFLEDDIEVSPLIFVFAERFIHAYGTVGNVDPSVLGYKLYNQKWDEVNQRQERTLENGHAPYKIQEPCSWGTVFAPQPYADYLAWYVHNSNIDPFIPRAWSNTWDPERSAKKYLQRYMWEKGRFLVAINLPDHLSLTTPRVDMAGTNMKAEWLDYLRQRLEVPLLTTGDIDFLRDHGMDPFFMPPAQSLVMLNTSHDIITSIVLPNRAEIEALNSDTLPPRELLDPSSARGARYRLLEKANAELREMLQDPHAPQRQHMDISAKQDAAMREMLMKAPLRGGAGLGQAYVNSIRDRGVLFTIARLLLGPRHQYGFIIDTQYGMTNRLRAYGSGKAIADSSNRFTVVIWEPDHHYSAVLEHIFRPPSDVHVLSDGAPIRALLQTTHASSAFVQYDLMDPARKKDLVDGRVEKHVYVRSAFQVMSKVSYGIANVLNMRELVSRTSQNVNAVLQAYYSSLPKVAGKTPEEVHEDIVGVHVRMVASVQEDTPGLDEEEALRMELATAFRVSCHYRYFLDMMMSFPKTKRFFLSADSPEAYRGLQAHPALRGRVFIVSDNACSSRTPQCLVYAAADLILLSRSSKLLTSRWSAFSETAGHLGGMETVDTCDKPAGGWLLSGSRERLTQQIIDYLRSQNYADVARVQSALQRF